MTRSLRRFCWRLLACGTLASISIPSSASGFLYPYDTFEGATLFNHLQWMRDLPDDMPLSDVSIPGTWNSNVMDSPSSLGVDVTASQVTTIEKQLDSGIRALSLSVQGTYTPGLPPYYSGSWKIESFDVSMLAISAFLAAHPSETVILRLDGTGGLLSPLVMSQRVNSVWVDPRWSQYFWKPGQRNPAIPTLGQVRGKIVLIQGPTVAQLNLSFAEQPGNPQFSVENDNHLSALSDLPAKWERVKAQLANAAANWQRGIFHTNTLHGEGSPPTYFAASGALTPFMGSPRMTTGHLSAFGNNGWEDFARTGCLGDYRLCSITYRGLNELTLRYIETARPVHVGLVWADFPGRGLIDAIIRVNNPDTPPVNLTLAGNRCLDVAVGAAPGTTSDAKPLTLATCNDQSTSQQWWVRDDGLIRWVPDTTRCVVANKGALDGRALQLAGCGDASTANVVRSNTGLFHLGATAYLCMQGKPSGVTLSLCNPRAPSQVWNLRRFSTLLAAGFDRCLGAASHASALYGPNMETRPCDPKDPRVLWLLDDKGAVRAPGMPDSGCLTANPNAASTEAIYGACKGGANQKWHLRPDGTLRPLSKAGACLDLGAVGETGTGKANVVACENGKASQQIGFNNTAVQLHWRDDRCMHLEGGDKVANGNAVVSFSCISHENRQWRLRSDQTVRTELDATFCLDIAQGEKMQAGQRMVVNACDGSNNQKWRWMADRSLRPAAQPDLCVATLLSGLKQGTKLQVETCGKSMGSQRWTPR